MTDTRTARLAEIRARFEAWPAMQDTERGVSHQIIMQDIPWLLDEVDAARRTALLEAADVADKHNDPCGHSCYCPTAQAIEAELRRRAEEKQHG